MMNFVLQMMNVVFKMKVAPPSDLCRAVSKVEELCIEKDEFCTENDDTK